MGGIANVAKRVRNVETVLEGNLEGIIDPLVTHYQAEALQQGAKQASQ
jgi:protein subunit release factor A